MTYEAAAARHQYLGLPVGTSSHAPSTHDQITQEIRWAGDLSATLSGVFGFFAFD